MPVIRWLAIAAIFACGGIAHGASSAPWADEVHELRLPNGMLFLLVNRGEAPVFSAYLAFRVGGIEEPSGQSGLAHLFEHLAFKGTRALTEVELTRKMLAAGGANYNATTSQDMTSYFVSLPTDQLRFWARLESERIFYPIFRDFYKERDVVLEERRMRVDDDPGGRLYEALLQTAFTQSPYRSPTIGSPQDIRGLTPAKAQRFFKRYYVPALAVGAIVGRIDLAATERLLRETFGRIPLRPAPPQAKPETTRERQARERLVPLRAKAQPLLFVAYHKPTLPDPDDDRFDLMAEYLTGGKNSLLYRELVIRRRLASAVDSFNGIPGARLPNLFLLEAAPLHPHPPQEVLKALDRELAGLRERPIPAAELETLKLKLKSALLWRMQTNEGLAAELASYQILAGSWRYLADYLERIETVTPEELRDLARRYLVPENRTVGILENEGGGS